MHNETNIPQTLQNPVDGSPMQLVWHDEFDGDTLDSTKWNLYDRMWSKNRVITTTDEKNITLQDGKVITAPGPGSAFDFGFYLIKTLAGGAREQEVHHGTYYR